MITIEEFRKVNLIIGEVKEIEKDQIIISCENKNFITKRKLKINKKDKIVIVVNGDEIIIPTISKTIPIIPESDIEQGSKIK